MTSANIYKGPHTAAFQPYPNPTPFFPILLPFKQGDYLIGNAIRTG